MQLGWRGRLVVKDILCMVYLEGKGQLPAQDEADAPRAAPGGAQPLDRPIGLYISLLGHRFLQLWEDHFVVSPINLYLYNASIVLTTGGRATEEHKAYMLEKFLFSPDKMNIRIFPKNNDQSSGGGGIPEAQTQNLPPFFMREITYVHIGLVATFFGDDRPLIERVSRKLNEHNTINRELVYSLKGT